MEKLCPRLAIKGILTILSLCLVAEVSIELQLSVQWSVTPSVYTLLILAANSGSSRIFIKGQPASNAKIKMIQ